MKIAHVSDIHLRNLKYHSEYHKVFENFYGLLREIQPDIVVNTGDTAHAKVQISPEFVQMCSDHIKAVSEIAPYHILLGNHDLNLANLNRRDAISPIVESINSDRVVLHKRCGSWGELWGEEDGYEFYIFSCADKKNYPTRFNLDPGKNVLRIGLFHGTVRGCETDTEWMMRDAELDISRFEGLDFVMMGDIHKHQFMDVEKRIAYAGSLIQQNYGESIEKGFLLWDIRSKDDFDVELIPVEGSRKFYTVELNDDLSIPDVELDEGSRVRLVSPRKHTLSEQHIFEREAKKRFKPYDLAVALSSNIGMQATNIAAKTIKMERLRDIDVQEKLIRKFLEGRTISDEVMSQILELNKRYQLTIEKEEEVIRDISWKVDSIAWNGMFNYGDGNVIDFSKMKGIIGMFAPNGSGKSALIDVITTTLFNKTTKGVNKNIELINDRKQTAEMVAYISTSDEQYVVERGIERVRYGKKKFEVEKEWGKTSLDFTVRNELGEEKVSGTQRTETEKLVRKRIGTYDDFVLTTLLTQGRESDLIKCKETERRKILSKFMDLDIFEQKAKMAKEESKTFVKKLKEIEGEDLEELKKSSELELNATKHEVTSEETKRKSIVKSLETLRDMISNLKASRKDAIQSFDIKKIERMRNDVFTKWSEWKTILDDQRCSLRSTKETLRDLEQERAVFPIEDYMRGQKELEGYERSIHAADADLENQSRILGEYMKNAKFLASVPCGDKYPKCKFLIEAFEKKGDIEEQREKVLRCQKTVREFEDEINSLKSEKYEEKIARYEQMTRKIAQMSSDVVSLAVGIENTELKMMSEWKDALRLDADELSYLKTRDDIEKNKDIDVDIERTEKMISVQQEQIEFINKKIIELTKKQGATEIIVEQVNKQMKELKKMRTLCDAYEHYCDAMGKHGISYQILVEKLPLLNEEINKILSTIVKFNVILDHNEDDQTISMFLQYGDHSNRNLKLAGGAEKLIASIAIRVALLSITNLPKNNMFIIDEGFGSLDAKNLDNINRMFNYLRMMFDHVLIISHIDLMKDMVDHSVTILTDDKQFSKVEVI